MTERLSFNLIPQDVADATVAMRPKNWGRYERLRLVFAGACIALSMYMAVVTYMWRRHALFLLGWEDALAFAFAGSVLGFLYGRLMANPGEDDPRLMARGFVLKKEGFETDGPGFHTEIDWTSVREITDRGAVILLVTEWGEAFFIPKRVFASPEAAAGFLTDARALYTARWNHFATSPAEADRHGPRFELSWIPERSDVAAFAKLKREITGWRKFFLFAPFLLAGGLLAVLGDRYPALGVYLDENGGMAVVIVAIFCGILFLLALVLQRIFRAIRIRRTPLPKGETKLVADPRGLDLTVERKRTRYAWKDIPAVTLGTSHVFLATARDRAIIVPRRAFRNRPAFLGFFNFAEEASQHAEA